MRKQLTGMLGLSLSAISPLAVALGLGQATVNSPLDAPLEATVPLQESEGFALSDLRVDLANESAFRALGLEWTSLTASISVQVQERPAGHRLLLRSSQAVHEPWLDLLLTISSPEGRQTRALTLLFDPPDYALDSPVDATGSAESPSRESASVLSAARDASRDIAYVASGDTLWSVAARVKPADVTIQQMMMALLAANPAAFPTGNIDELRAGQTLNIPTRQQITSRTSSNAAQAIQAVRSPVGRQVESQEKPEGLSGSSVEQVVEPARQSDDQGAALSLQKTGVVAIEKELAEQLLEGQDRLLAVLDESEEMHDELAVLRQEVASLTQALSASQRELQQAQELSDMLAGSAALMANSRPANEVPNLNRSQSASATIVERMAAYQWPLASSALALLLGALVWSRRRRERQWEDVAPISSAYNADTMPTATPSPATPPPTKPSTTSPPPTTFSPTTFSPTTFSPTTFSTTTPSSSIEPPTRGSPTADTVPANSEPGPIVEAERQETSSPPGVGRNQYGGKSVEERWEVEEVAFEPRRRDNGAP
ncbi:FimV/HubP family polar landmark protein [Halomonas venusta]|uniref:type IV pilus assembly protein FimV n=1 Tax=Vreelandella venusta TaxID=44935 RepID=UPI00295E775F|nr:FimV/HubP family polar landmark protein [Halomonas venusta]MDW0361444.1 FimV/HubP family polar landmark protein [Halomonas venusta]